MDLNQKNILFIGPVFFGYETDIMSELKRRGAKINFVPENLDHLNAGYKLMCSMPSGIRTKWIHKYFKNRIRKFETYDVVFMIRGVWLDAQLLDWIKQNYSAKWIMYQWDGSKNIPNLSETAGYFDERYTFDRQDCIQFEEQGIKWNYRPLFFAKEFENCKEQDEWPYTLFYNGSLHSGRAAFLKKLQKFAKANNLSMKGSLFMKRLNFMKRRYINGEYKELSKTDITHQSMDRNALINQIEECKVIVDYTNPNQTGLTMRSIECFGANKKFATNNKAIANEAFYRPENIYIYDEENFDIPNSFLDIPYEKTDEETYHKYSLAGWIEDIFGKE